MGWESFHVVKFDLRPLLQSQTRIAKLKSAYNSLIIGHRDLQCEANLRKSWAGNFLMWSYLTFSPCFKVKQGQPNLKVLITHLLLVLEVCNVKPTYRESFDVVTVDLGPLLQGQTRIAKLAKLAL